MELRPYQEIGTKRYIQEKKSVRRQNIASSSGLIHMATGSGKTPVSATILNYVLKVRERYERIFGREFPLKISVLSHRIDMVDQLHDEFIIGRNGQTPLINESFRNKIHRSIHHSQSDQGNYHADTDGKGIKMVFSTFQTALSDNLQHIQDSDIVVVDDAHVVTPGSDYLKVINHLTQTGKKIHFIANTGTPDNFTREIFGEPVYFYSLGEYLASPYSPSLSYEFIGQTEINKEDIKKFLERVNQAASIQDLQLRKKATNKLKKEFNNLLVKHEDIPSLVSDLIPRLSLDENGKIGPTLIFCKSVKEANKIAECINSDLHQEKVAYSYHSQNDANNALSRLSDPRDSCRVLVVVDKMNEGIDAPAVKNIVFWRGTDSEKIFLQQFGRGLRGDKHVRYFDYVGGLKNFSGIYDIYSKYRYYKSRENENIKHSEENNNFIDPDGKFMLHGAFGSFQSTNIDLSFIGLKLTSLDRSCRNSTTFSAEEFTHLFKKGDIKEFHLKANIWTDFAREWNNINTPIFLKHLPLSLDGVFNIYKCTGSKRSSRYICDIIMGRESPEGTQNREISPEKDVFEKLNTETKAHLLHLLETGFIPEQAFDGDSEWLSWIESQDIPNISIPELPKGGMPWIDHLKNLYPEHQDWLEQYTPYFDVLNQTSTAPCGTYMSTLQHRFVLQMLSRHQIINIADSYTKEKLYFLAGHQLRGSLARAFPYDCYRYAAISFPKRAIVNKENLIMYLRTGVAGGFSYIQGEDLKTLIVSEPQIMDLYFKGWAPMNLKNWNNNEGKRRGFFLPPSHGAFIKAYTGKPAKHAGKRHIIALIQGQEFIPKKRFRTMSDADIHDLYHAQKISDDFILSWDWDLRKDWNQTVGASLEVIFENYGRVYWELRAKRKKEYDEFHWKSNKKGMDEILTEVVKEYLELIKTKPREFFL